MRAKVAGQDPKDTGGATAALSAGGSFATTPVVLVSMGWHSGTNIHEPPRRVGAMEFPLPSPSFQRPQVADVQLHGRRTGEHTRCTRMPRSPGARTRCSGMSAVISTPANRTSRPLLLATTGFSAPHKGRQKFSLATTKPKNSLGLARSPSCAVSANHEIATAL